MSLSRGLPRRSDSLLNDVPAGNLRAALSVRVRYSLEGFTKPVPREVRVEASGEMSSFDQAIVDLTNAPANP
jgi:hypothetical protein